jgi:hypothetical protein
MRHVLLSSWPCKVSCWLWCVAVCAGPAEVRHACTAAASCPCADRQPHVFRQPCHNPTRAGLNTCYHPNVRTEATVCIAAVAVQKGLSGLLLAVAPSGLLLGTESAQQCMRGAAAVRSAMLCWGTTSSNEPLTRRHKEQAHAAGARSSNLRPPCAGCLCCSLQSVVEVVRRQQRLVCIWRGLYRALHAAAHEDFSQVIWVALLLSSKQPKTGSGMPYKFHQTEIY